jgi:phosphoenolpyruvate carboxylase
MTFEEAKPIVEALEECAREIQALRHANEIKSARLQMFDEVMCILHTKPASLNDMAASVDVAWVAKDLAAQLNSRAVSEKDLR